MHIHIDPLGGLAGDMFIGAVLDAWPDYFGGLEAAVRAAGLPSAVTLRFTPHSDHALTGGRFLVDVSGDLPAPAGAGTGRGPWAVITRPRPSGNGATDHDAAPSRSTR
jgi:hypothetical protein